MSTFDLQTALQQAATSTDAADILQAGAEALRRGAFQQAIAPVRTALRTHANNARLWQLLGLLSREADDLGSAVEAFDQASRLAPDDAMIAHGRACVSFEAGLPASALFDRARQLAPNDRSILLRHSAAEIAEGRSQQAIDRLDAHLLSDPQWLEGHAALSRTRWASGDRTRFAASLERALQSNPRVIPLWAALIQLLLHDGLHADALAVIDRARTAAGPNPSFDAAEAICRSELGEYQQAGPLFDRLARVADVGFLVHRLRFLIRTGRVKEAAEISERLAPRDPSHQIWPYLSICWRLLGDPRWQWLEGDPRFIGVYDLAEDLPDLGALAERLRAIHRTSGQPIDQSLRGGRQTDGNLFSRLEPEIRTLREAMLNAVRKHVAQLPPPQPGHPLLVQRREPIRFAGSWSVQLTGGGHHVDHCHPAGWLSSVFYVALPDDRERGPDQAGWLSLGQASDLGVDLDPIRVVEPKPGRLVLFPSTMWHGTRPFEAGERLTVAFDVRRPA